MTKAMVEIFSDGATIGKNGKLGSVKKVGLGVYIPAINFGDGKRVKGGSNNEAEFKALIWAMETAINKKIKRAVFKSDSQIIINRANGKRPKGKFKNERMDNFQNKVFKLKEKFDEVYFNWLPREQNQVADYYSKK